MMPLLMNSLPEAIDGLEAAIGLDVCQEYLIHSLIVFRAVGQGYAVKIKGAEPQARGRHERSSQGKRRPESRAEGFQSDVRLGEYSLPTGLLG